jgi:ribosomal protein S18 acetylase RimI-like enzyme
VTASTHHGGSPPLRIRPAIAADQPFVLATAARLADFELPPWRIGAEIVGAEQAVLAARFAAGERLADVLLAEGDGGSPLGFVYLERLTDYFTGGDHGHVSMLAIAPGAEGRGVGTALMAAAEAWARERGLPYLTLNVFAGNHRARALYERLGYQPDTVKYRKPL